MAKKNLFQTVFVFTLTLFVIFIALLVSFNAFVLYKKFLNEEQKIKQEILSSKKELIKSEVEFFNSLINKSRLKLERKIKQQLKQKVDIAHSVALSLAQNNASEELIIEALRKISINKKDEYIFLLKMDGTILLLPNFSKYETKNLLKEKNFTGKDVILKMINLIKNNKEAFLEYKWMKKDKNFHKQKTSYLKYLKELDCIVGTGIYKDDFEKLLQKDILEKINIHKFGTNKKNYIFAGTYDGLSLAGPAKGKNVYDLKDINGLKVVQELISTAKKGNGYVKYIMPIGDNKVTKISYVIGINPWKWYIGSGETLEGINEVVKEKKKELLKELYSNLIFIFGLAALFFVIFYFVFSNKKESLNKELSSFIDSLNRLFNEDKKIDRSILMFEEFDKISKQANNIYDIKQKIEKELKRKEYLLFQQSKMASMGELVESIAHQWRQPLSIITTTATGMQIKKEFDDLDDMFFNESLDSITENAQYLSSTIDDFRNFFYKTSVKEEFYFEDVLNKAFKLIKSKLEAKNINIIKFVEHKKIISYKNELLQVILIILNNAKDALDDENIIDKYIFIDTFIENDSFIITFKDNAKGITLKNKEDIFNAYVSTKNSSTGTGIGLYMAKEIVEKHMEGKISVENIEYSYQNKLYSGACFTIVIPSCN